MAKGEVPSARPNSDARQGMRGAGENSVLLKIDVIAWHSPGPTTKQNSPSTSRQEKAWQDLRPSQIARASVWQEAPAGCACTPPGSSSGAAGRATGKPPCAARRDASTLADHRNDISALSWARVVERWSPMQTGIEVSLSLQSFQSFRDPAAPARPEVVEDA
ncbi:hypothetical protein [Paracoccus aerius]|uniref:hypothetical protein n=1 Tax=Paracoccus aerius TaxID=1915382 RepID=UPI0019251E93|nr:hypothetical protein [Paracoccus aerius]